MTNQTSPTRLPLGTLTTHRIVSALSEAVARLGAWNERRRTLAALRRLDTAQLEDIGLTPEALDRFAREGRL